jgi:hypothetical protein
VRQRHDLSNTERVLVGLNIHPLTVIRKSARNPRVPYLLVNRTPNVTGTSVVDVGDVFARK